MPKITVQANLSSNVSRHIDVGEVKHTGGEANIYFSNDNKYAAKIYHQHVVHSDKRQFLSQIVSLGEKLNHELEYLCWPISIVEQLYLYFNPRVWESLLRWPRTPG